MPQNDYDATGDPEEQLDCGKPRREIHLCYMICPKDAADGFLGALLLTDYRARPLHFAYVKPVKPSVFQKILYGSVLEEHLKVDVIGQKLWEGLPKQPDALFVDDRDLIALRRIVRIPTAFLEQSPEAAQRSSSLSNYTFDDDGYSGDKPIIGQLLNALEHTCRVIAPKRQYILAWRVDFDKGRANDSP